MLAYRHNWGEDRVVFVAADGRVRSMPAAWTDAGERDPFVALAAGRAWFRTEDLLALVALVRGLADAAERRPTGRASCHRTDAATVTGMMPPWRRAARRAGRRISPERSPAAAA